MKKIIVCLIALLMIFPGFASAASVSELQAQIANLMAQIKQLQAQIVQQTGGSTYCHNFNSDLKIGDSGNEVDALRAALVKQGFLTDKDLSMFDNFDEVTASAVSAFQEKYMSEILNPAALSHGTGYLGARTRAKLNQLYGCGNVKPTPVPPVACSTLAKLCPDGKTYVSPVSPSCEFAACPTTYVPTYVQPPTITTTSPLPNAKVGQPYSLNITAAGGSDMYKWILTSGEGSLPPGLLSGVAVLCSSDPCRNPVGINGIPTTAGTYYFTFSVTSGSQSVSKQFNLTVDPTAVTSTSQPYINVISPSGSNINQGQQTTITWSSFMPDWFTNRLIGLDLYQNGNFVSNIVTGISNAGYYVWTVPTTLSGSGFKIRAVLLGAKEGSGDGYSPTSFSIVASATASNPGCSLSATPSTTSLGGNVTLSWSCQNVTTCSIGRYYGGFEQFSPMLNYPTPTVYNGTSSGSGTVSQLSQTTQFVLHCTSPSGTAVQSATVTIN